MKGSCHFLLSYEHSPARVHGCVLRVWIHTYAAQWDLTRESLPDAWFKRKDFQLAQLNTVLFSFWVKQWNEDLENVIMNHVKSPSDNFRTIIAKGSWFLISSIITFQTQSNSKALISTQPYFQQNSICLNEEDKHCATKETNLKVPFGKCSRCYWYPTQTPYKDGRN